MKKTHADATTPGGIPGIPGNPPSIEVGPKDSGGGQSLLATEPINRYSLDEVEELKRKCLLLTEENQLLHNKIRSLEARFAEIEKKEESPHTDEEEFTSPQKEVKMTPKVQYEWVINSRKSKKRKATNSPIVEDTPPGPSPPLQRETRTDIRKFSKEVAPPPIYISGLEDINKVTDKLRKLNFKGKISSFLSGDAKINCVNGEEYLGFTKMLNKEKEAGLQIEWHTYADKNTSPLKVMARGLDPATDPAVIINDLKSKNFKIVSAVNIRKPELRRDPLAERGMIKSQVKLRLFMLTFENSESIDRIYDIRPIAYQVVKIEAIRRNSTRIVQCKNCQGYNHARSSCYRKPRCVKCAGEHSTEICHKPKSSQPLCANCGEAHTANYRGCIIAKELQKRRDEIINCRKKANNRSKQIVRERQTELRKELSEVKQAQMANKAKSTYADCIVQGNTKDTVITSGSDITKILEALEKLTSRLDLQEKFYNMKINMIEGKLAKTK